MAMLRLMLLALVAAWATSLVRLARLWRAPATAPASGYDGRFVS